MKIRAALFGALGCVCLAAPAHAEPSAPAELTDTDNTFLVSLQAAGITYKSPDQAINAARVVCGLIADGKPSPKVLEGLKANNPGLTTEHGSQFVGIAAQVYCPDQLVQSATKGLEESAIEGAGG